MTIAQYLDESTRELGSRGIESARLDTLILMEYVTGYSRAQLLASGDNVLSSKHKNVLNKLMTTRSKHIPIAQITNERDFYGRRFYVDNSVMIPRPETEVMIELFLYLYHGNEKLNKRKGLTIADVGTGSGVIGITIKKELPKTTVDLVDIDIEALKVAKINVVMHTISISTIQSDLLNTTTKSYAVLLCNLPYVPDDHDLNMDAHWDPKIAIYGGQDGLDVYRRLFGHVSKLKNKPLLILTESLTSQHKILAKIATNSGYTQLANKGLIQAFKLSTF